LAALMKVLSKWIDEIPMMAVANLTFKTLASPSRLRAVRRN
jgi:hypothetical protein